MNIDWSDADPQHFFSALNRLVVAVNGEDYLVAAVATEGLYVRRWSDDDADALGESELIEWDDVKTLYIY